MKHLNVDRQAIEAPVPHLPVNGTPPVIRGSCSLFGCWGRRLRRHLRRDERTYGLRGRRDDHPRLNARTAVPVRTTGLPATILLPEQQRRALQQLRGLGSDYETPRIFAQAVEQTED